MSKESHLAACLIEEAGGEFSEDTLRDIRNYKRRLDSVEDSRRKFGDNDQFRSEAAECYYELLRAVQEVVPSEKLTELESHAAFREKFEAFDEDKRIQEYLAATADFIQRELRTEQADDIMYVPQHVAAVPYGVVVEGHATPRRERGSNLVHSIVNSAQTVIVLRGWPGAGKSVALRQVVRVLASHAHGDTRKPIPLLVSLAKFGVFRADVAKDAAALAGQYADWVHQQIERSIASIQHRKLRFLSRYIVSKLQEILRSRHCFLLFDGMDELPREGYDATCRALVAFARSHGTIGSNRFLFACREFDYPQELKVYSLVLLPFDWADVRRYLQTHLPKLEFDERQEELRGLWRREGGARELLDNPFFLHLLTIYMQAHPGVSLPMTRGKLLDDYAKRILSRESTGAASKISTAKLTESIEALAAWITHTKISGTTANWSDLEGEIQGKELAEVIRANVTDGRYRYFLDINAAGMSFRHHRLREFFAASAFLRGLHSARSSAPHGMAIDLQEAGGDVWYYETLILMASLATSSAVQLIIDQILKGESNGSARAHRARLAAECLEASSVHRSDSLCGRVFAALSGSIRDSSAGEIDQVECWRTLSRLEVGAVQLTELPELLRSASRFVREEALASVARMTQVSLPTCRPTAWGLVREAVKLGALDRLFRYRAWVFSASIRSVPLVLGYLALSVLLLLAWLAPVPASIILAFRALHSVAPEFRSVLSVAIGTEVASFIVFLWLNENHRTPRGCLKAVSFFLRRMRVSDSREYSKTVLLWIGPHLFVIILGIAAMAASLHRTAYEQERDSLVRSRAVAEAETRALTVQRRIRQVFVAAPPPPREPQPVRAAPPPPPAPPIHRTREQELRESSSWCGRDFVDFREIFSRTGDPSSTLRNFRILRDGLGPQAAANTIALSRAFQAFDLGMQREHVGGACISLNWIADFVTRILTNPSSNADQVAANVLRNWRETNARSEHMSLDFGQEFEFSEEYNRAEQILPAEIEYARELVSRRDVVVEGALLVNNLITFDAYEALRTASADSHLWYRTTCSELVAVMCSRVRAQGSIPLPRAIVQHAMDQLRQPTFLPASRQSGLTSAIHVFDYEFERWSAAQAEVREARRQAAIARIRAREAQEALRRTQIERGALGLLCIFFLSSGLWLYVRYVRPRMHIRSLNTSHRSAIIELIGLAGDQARDVALRKLAVGKVAESDELEAREGLLRLAKSESIPETLKVEILRAQNQQERRRLRRGTDV